MTPPAGGARRDGVRPARRGGLRPDLLGLWLGLLAMVMFGLTLPMTRLAIGDDGAPQLSPAFVTFGRAAVAAALSAAVLLHTRPPLPQRAQWPALVYASLGNVIGYPLLLALALRSVTAAHAAVITALLPLTTAAVAAWMLRQRAGVGFWACAAAGTGLVVAYSLLRSMQGGSGFRFESADIVLLAAVLAASFGYVQGARVTAALGAERVICWVTLLALPVTLPGALLTWPQGPVSAAAWGGFAYLGVFSMWLALFVWYRALDVGGALRVSQVQLLQPFFAIASAVPLLGERIDAITVGFALAIVVVVFVGKRAGAPRGRLP